MNPWNEPFKFTLSVHRRQIPDRLATELFEVTLGGHDGSSVDRRFEIMPLDNAKEIIANNLASAFIELLEKVKILR